MGPQLASSFGFIERTWCTILTLANRLPCGRTSSSILYIVKLQSFLTEKEVHLADFSVFSLKDILWLGGIAYIWAKMLTAEFCAKQMTYDYLLRLVKALKALVEVDMDAGNESVRNA